MLVSDCHVHFAATLWGQKIERVLCSCGKRQWIDQLRALNSDIRRPHRNAVFSQGHRVRNILCSWCDSNSHLWKIDMPLYKALVKLIACLPGCGVPLSWFMCTFYLILCAKLITMSVERKDIFSDLCNKWQGVDWAKHWAKTSIKHSKAVRNIKGNGLQGAYLPLHDSQELSGCRVPALLLPFSVSLLFIILLLWGNKKKKKKLLSSL